MKKIKIWIYNKIFKDITEMHIKYQLDMKKTIDNKNEQINNLKKQINFLTMKGPML